MDAEGTTSALMFSCSGRCGHRRRDWLGSDVALSQSAGYAAGWTRGSSHDQVKSRGYDCLPGSTRSIPSQMRAPRQIASSSPPASNQHES
jgi:hypothetical protein